ncbi:alpha/beta hydrolase family protein [Catellatospora paridis]|uniref:alpha/beta hydrolase family protein n=1 Tax=Catellatospora paridis TaxID=1617086 RepID=UPI001E6161BD|nr:prolyl oligopeptidase family serine peptidase [Catellatospora paridis]
MLENGTGTSVPTAHEVAQAGTSYDWLTSFDGLLYWVESSPEVAQAVMSWDPSAATRSCHLAGEGVGSSLHAYGGMPYAVLAESEIALVNASAGQIVAGAVSTATAHSYGDLAWSDSRLWCVREDGSGDEVVNVDPATGDLRVVRSTDGFLASPTANAGRLAWTQWDKDVMPWDSCNVWVADHGCDGHLGLPVHVAGSPDESAVQPRWGVDGSLYFLSDRTGWWNLYRWHDGGTEAVAPMDAECATAPWESGYANYVLLPAGRIGMTVQHGPVHRLVVLEADRAIRSIELPYTTIKPYLAALGDRIALIGASPTRSQEIAVVATDGSDDLEVIRRSSGQIKATTELSVPEIMKVRSGGADVHVLFYPPAGGAGHAPLIVRPHAGPTYHSDLRLDWEVQFFTSRGFAVADVDYRGSTGYGRAYRKALDGHWGRLDVEDCRNVAEYLLASGHARPGAVFISGASAGGYTALRAVCEDGPFSLAVARSAIVDPKRWTTTAPRFQQPHAAILAHDVAEVRAERVQRPVLLIHGDRDHVAPIDDVLKLAADLDDRKLLVRLLEIEDAGHYLSNPTALAEALEAELTAYAAVLKAAGPAQG